MKKYISLLILSAIVIGASTSCSFLDENPLDRMELEKSLNNEEEAVMFLYGGYGLVKSATFGHEFFSTTDLMTDDNDYSSTDVTRRALSALTYNPTSKNLKGVWAKQYAVIEQVNILIKQLETKSELHKVGGTLLMAEARFIRAWAYLNLVQIWGEVPLITIPLYDIKKDNLYPKRASVEAIYSQIVQDLVYAATELGDKAGSVTFKTDIKYPLVLRRATAKLLLAKTYLIMKQYEDVLATLSYFGTDVNNLNADFGLVDEFKYLFDVRDKSREDRGKEVLWEIEAKSEAGLNNTMHREMAPSELKDSRGVPLTGQSTGYQSYIPTYDLISTFDTKNDKRYKQGYQLSKSAPDTRPHIMKGYDVLTLDQNTGGANVILLRMADAYLVMAEAYNELGSPADAKPFVDLIRTRAGLAPLADNLTQVQMRAAIMLERRHEFAHEGAYRLFDLRRTGTYKTVMQEYIKRQSFLLLGTDGDTEIPTKVKLYDPVSGTLTNEINIPFVKINKVWQDKHILHAIPMDERVANKNIVVKDNWN